MMNNQLLFEAKHLKSRHEMIEDGFTDQAAFCIELKMSGCLINSH